MKFIVGIDEVGRGALAGPVTVAAVAVPKNLGFRIQNLGKLKDSKRLSPKQREAWLEHLKNNPKITYALARVYPRTIERINISRAANTAALRVFDRLISSSQFPTSNCRVYLDGGLYLGNRRGSTRTKLVTVRKILHRSQPSQRLSVRTVVRGDEKITAVKIASIVAKVNRDKSMRRLAKKYPQYGFEVHKGYGTKKHFGAIKKYGPSEVHRLTFLS